MERRVDSPLPDSEWRIADAPVPYEDAVATMEARAAAVLAGEARELIWLLEHPPIYTAGTSAAPADLLDPRFPVHKTGRGGKYPYHGPPTGSAMSCDRKSGGAGKSVTVREESG